MKISRIDVIGQNGNDGAAYDGFGAEWLAKSGLLDDDGAAADRSGQNGLPDPVEGARPQGPERQMQGNVLLAAVPESARPAVRNALVRRGSK